MCISMFPSEMSNTKIYVGDADYNGKYVHVLAYQNKATNNHKGPNAMILPIPTDVLLEQENFVDMSNDPNKDFLTSFAEATKRQTKGMRFASYAVAAGMTDDLSRYYKVYDVGSYTVVSTNGLSKFTEALQMVPEHKRPDDISNEMKVKLHRMYTNYNWIIACWNGAVNAEPILVYYEPKDPSKLFVPTMDAHNGDAPSTEDEVDTDHNIIVGSKNKDYRNWSRDSVKFKETTNQKFLDLIPENRLCGTQISGHHENKDMYFYLNQYHHNDKVPFLTRGESKYKVNGWS